MIGNRKITHIVALVVVISIFAFLVWSGGGNIRMNKWNEVWSSCMEQQNQRWEIDKELFGLDYDAPNALDRAFELIAKIEEKLKSEDTLISCIIASGVDLRGKVGLYADECVNHLRDYHTYSSLIIDYHKEELRILKDIKNRKKAGVEQSFGDEWELMEKGKTAERMRIEVWVEAERFRRKINDAVWKLNAMRGVKHPGDPVE